MQTKFWRINLAQLMCAFCSACAKPNCLVMTMMAYLLRLSLVSMATSMEITFDCSFLYLIVALGSQGGASLLEASPDSMNCSNQHTKLGPFSFISSFNCNSSTNDNQTFIVYAKGTLVLFRKGICGFFILEFALGEKLHRVKCRKF